MPGTHYVTDKDNTLYDTVAETKYEPGVVENIAYGTSSFKVPVNENVAYYDKAHNQVSMRENAAYGTSAKEVPMNENTAYGISTGPVYDDVD